MKRKILSLLLCFLLASGAVAAVPQCAVEVGALTTNQQNILDRANCLFNLKWKCEKDTDGWNGYYYKGNYYRMPYAQCIDSGLYIGFEVSVANFMAATADPTSDFYTMQSTYLAYDDSEAPYYGIDCSVFVSLCWGLDEYQTTMSLHNYADNYGVVNEANIDKLQIGDALNKNAYHVCLVTDVKKVGGKVDYVEITEQTKPKVKRTLYSRKLITTLYGNDGYEIFRCKVDTRPVAAAWAGLSYSEEPYDPDYDYLFLGDGTVAIERYCGRSPVANIPSEIHGKPVSKLNNYAFANNPILTDVNIPASVTKLAADTFWDCPKLERLNVAAENAVYSSIDGVVYDNGGKNVKVYPAGKKDTAFVVPAGVTSVGGWSFANNKKLENLRLPDTVTSIGKRAFMNSEKLAAVTIPPSVTDIVHDAGAPTEIFLNHKAANLTVYGKADSLAETCAQTEGVGFIAVSFVPDDISPSAAGSAAGVEKLPEQGAFRGIPQNTAVQDVLAFFEQSSEFLDIRDKDGGVLVDNAVKVGTGCTVNIVDNGEVKRSYALVVIGDVCADAHVDGVDYVTEKKVLKGMVTLSGAYALAADMNKDGVISAADCAALALLIRGE